MKYKSATNKDWLLVALHCQMISQDKSTLKMRSHIFEQISILKVCNEPGSNLLLHYQANTKF